MQVLLVRRRVNSVGPLKVSLEEVKTHKCLLSGWTDVTDIRFMTGVASFMTLAFILAQETHGAAWTTSEFTVSRQELR
jgi:hypothetical protein